MEDQDVYYAPEENGDASGEMGASQGAVGSLPGSASYLSHAKLMPFEWGHPGKALDGVELYLNGQFLGSSPLSLDGYMVQRTQLNLGGPQRRLRRSRASQREDPRGRRPARGPAQRQRRQLVHDARLDRRAWG